MSGPSSAQQCSAVGALNAAPGILQVRGAHARERLNRQIDCRNYAYAEGIDMPRVSSSAANTGLIDLIGGGAKLAGPRDQRHKFDPDVAELICDLIAEGQSLRRICQDKNGPARSTIFGWLEEHEEFARRYTLARQIQIEDLMDEILEIADDSTNDWIVREGPDGKSTAYPILRVFGDPSCRSQLGSGLSRS